jgi:putative chitinase
VIADTIKGVSDCIQQLMQEVMMDRAVKIVKKIFSNAKPAYVAAFEAGDAQLATAGIDTPLRLAHLLAQCGAESGGLTLARESLMYKTASVLQGVFNNMKLTKPLMPGEVKMLLLQEKDLGERFYGLSFPSALYQKNGMNGGINPGNTKKAQGLGNDRIGDGFLFRGNGLLQTTGGKAHKEAGDNVHVDFFNHPELVTAAEHALKPMLFEWTAMKCNTFADADDLLKVSRAINLGKPNSPATPNGMPDRKKFLKAAKQALGI